MLRDFLFLKPLYEVEGFLNVNTLSISFQALFEPCDWSTQNKLCVSKVVTGNKLCISELVTGNKLGLSELVTGNKLVNN